MQIPNTFISCQTPKEKNIHIVSLRNESESVSNQNDKQRLTFERFQHHIGTCSQRKHLSISNNSNGNPNTSTILVDPSLTMKLQKPLRRCPGKKRGPNGFIGSFFKNCWETIKLDIMTAIIQFYNMNQQSMYYLNQALVVLNLKKPNVEWN
jgi:hypothetical protein